MVEAENYSRTKTPLEVQLIPILGQEFQPCIQYNFLSTGVISMMNTSNYSDEEFCAQPLSTVWLMYATKAELEKDD